VLGAWCLRLAELVKRAGAGAARVAARAAGCGLLPRVRGPFRVDGEDRELFVERFTGADGADRCSAAVHERLERVAAAPADVLEDWHVTRLPSAVSGFESRVSIIV
jgi:hypothetical protein